MNFTEQKLTSIQAPTLCATLSKLHLNRNTSRAIIFGPPCYCGIQLPTLPTTKGIDHLTLMLGHLRSQDEIADLIYIDLSMLQLYTGSCTFFLHLPFPTYQKWMECGWLMSIWDFVFSSGIKLYVNNIFLPKPCCENDRALMDVVVQLGLSRKELLLLNLC